MILRGNDPRIVNAQQVAQIELRIQRRLGPDGKRHKGYETRRMEEDFK